MILFLARFFGFLTLIPLLARLIILSILLILSKKLVPIRVNSWLNQNMKTNPKRTQTNPIFQRPNPVFGRISRIFDKFRKHFLCKTNPIQFLFSLMNYNINPILAQSFLRAQDLGSAESGYVLLYIEHFGLSRIRRAREKESPKRKTKPFQSQTKPFFWRPNPILSEKTGIFEDFRQTFLCKTKPFFSKIQIENKGLTAVSACPAPKSLVLW